MSSLHTISKAPSSGFLDQCLPFLGQDDGLLFIEDGVYNCLDQLDLPDIEIFSLKEDMKARGISDRNRAATKTINYLEFVELCCNYDKVVSWF